MKQIRLSQGLWALVNDQDFEWANQWKWSASREGRNGLKWYAVRREFDPVTGKQRKVRLHIEIWKRNTELCNPILRAKYKHGVHVIDHVSNNGLDCRFCDFEGSTDQHYQLQMLTQTENMKRAELWGKRMNKRTPDSGAGMHSYRREILKDYL